MSTNTQTGELEALIREQLEEHIQRVEDHGPSTYPYQQGWDVGYRLGFERVLSRPLTEEAIRRSVGLSRTQYGPRDVPAQHNQGWREGFQEATEYALEQLTGEPQT